MNAGQLNRRITIQEAQTTISNTGATSKSWVSYLSLFAHMKEDAGGGSASSESSRSDVLFPVHRVLWTIRWSAAANAITPQMRLSYGGEYYHIMSVQNVGIKEYIQIITEMRGSGSGAAPVACDPATYSNGGAFTQEIAAGGTFTADPITVTDVNGVVRSSLPNIAVVCAWIALSIRNSQGTVIQSVASYPSGAIITIADQTTNVRASDGESIETVVQIVGASVELTDFEVTAPSYSITIAARRKIKIVGSVPTSTEIEGEFIAITMPSGGTCDDATYSNGGAFTQSIPSGDTYTAPNIIVTDVNGIQRSVLPNINITALWATLTTKNTLGDTLSTVASYPSGGDIVVPNQSIDLLASDDYVLRSLTQVVGADVTANDIEITDGAAFTQEFAARGGILIVGSTITSTVIDGDYIEITVPTPAVQSGIAYKCTNPTGNTSQRTGDCVSRFLSGEYDRTMPAYPTHYAELDRSATQADVRITPATGTLSTDLVQPTMLVANNKFGNKFRYTDDIGNPSDATVGSNLWAHVDWNNHSWTGATAGIVVDNLYNIEMDVDYLLVGAKYSLSSAETHGQSWTAWIDDIVALGTHKGRTGWRPLDVAYAFSGAHAAKCEPDLVWADEFFNSQRSDNRCGMMTGETSDTNQYLYVVDSNTADMLHNATIGSDIGFQSDITNVFIIRTATT
jgi:head-tail adaptor